jgi:hypothetical protein
MTLPAHLQRYDSLIDLIVEQVMREVEQSAEIKTGAGSRPAPANFNHQADQPPCSESHETRTP